MPAPRLITIVVIALMMLLCGTQRVYGGVEYKFRPVDREFDSIAEMLLKKEFYHRSEPDVGKSVEQLIGIANRRGNSQLKARAIFWEARTGQIVGKPEEQIRKLEKARSMSDPDFTYDLAFINYQLAGNYQRLGKYYTSYQLIQQALPIFIDASDDYALGNAYLLLVLIYRDIGEIELASENLELSRRHYAAAGFPLNRVYFFEAILEPDTDKSISLYRQSVLTGSHEPPMTLQALLNIAQSFLGKGQPDSTAVYLSRACKLVENGMKGGPFEEMLLEKKALLAIHEKRYSDVLAITDSIEELNRTFPGEHLTPQLYLMRSKALEAMGRNDEAFKALKRYQVEQDENLRLLEAREIPKAREREAISRQKEMMAQLQERESARRSRLYIILLALSVLLVAAAGFILYFYQRSKIRKIQNRELRNNLEQQMVISRFNRENFERDMQKKECEISSSVLLVSNKNDVLQHISDITKEYYDAGKIPIDYVNRINSAVGDSLKADDDWDRFKLHFESVHPGFFTKLKERYSELTENDLRLCAYLRIGLRPKEIATMLTVSPASINTARYRMRKKLNLAKDESLDDLIRAV